MRIASLSLKNFRCFASIDLDFDSPVILLHGPNGSGKTSLLESLHYACYLRSFKTHLPRELITGKKDGFSISAGLIAQPSYQSQAEPQGSFDHLHITFSRNKRTVKLNEQNVASFKELYDVYKVVTITEDDLTMIQGSPSLRRTFLDHKVLLMNPDYALLGRKYRTILENRNALLASGRLDEESYMLWTNQLLSVALVMQEERKKLLTILEHQTHELMQQLSMVETVSLSYEYARPYSDISQISTAEELLIRYPSLMGHELAQKRSLFGAHLDDFTVLFQEKAARSFASRGQQKLIVFLLKLASIKSMKETGESSVILLVDDFMTDFDVARADALLPLMTSLPSQLIITTPIVELIHEKLKSYNCQLITLQPYVASTDKVQLSHP